VQAVTFHYFSTAIEDTGSATFTGVKEYRVDKAVTGIPLNGCTQPHTGTPVYQTMWVQVHGGLTAEWFELGTGHQCNDTYRFWFWGYGYNGNWVPLGEDIGQTNGQSHWFSISRAIHGGNHMYDYKIDGSLKEQLESVALGEKVFVMLESWASNANTVFPMTVLQYQKSEGAWLDFSGRDDTNIDSVMCGYWIADQTFKAGQPSSNC
jgi:hypothetical protein